MLLALYSDIIKYSHINLNQKIQSKAIVLNRQKIKPRLIKVNLFLFFSFLFYFILFFF